MPAAGRVAERVDRGTVLNLPGVNCVCLLVRWLNGGRRGEKDWSSTPNFPSFCNSGGGSAQSRVKTIGKCKAFTL